MILKVRLGGEVEWQIWDNIERLHFSKISLAKAKEIKADYNMIKMDSVQIARGVKKGFSSDRDATFISMVHRGRGVTITSNSPYIFLLNDEGKTIERI